MIIGILENAKQKGKCVTNYKLEDK